MEEQQETQQGQEPQLAQERSQKYQPVQRFTLYRDHVQVLDSYLICKPNRNPEHHGLLGKPTINLFFYNGMSNEENRAEVIRIKADYRLFAIENNVNAKGNQVRALLAAPDFQSCNEFIVTLRERLGIQLLSKEEVETSLTKLWNLYFSYVFGEKINVPDFLLNNLRAYHVLHYCLLHNTERDAFPFTNINFDDIQIVVDENLIDIIPKSYLTASSATQLALNFQQYLGYKKVAEQYELELAGLQTQVDELSDQLNLLLSRDQTTMSERSIKKNKNKSKFIKKNKSTIAPINGVQVKETLEKISEKQKAIEDLKSKQVSHTNDAVRFLASNPAIGRLIAASGITHSCDKSSNHGVEESSSSDVSSHNLRDKIKLAPQAVPNTLFRGLTFRNAPGNGNCLYHAIGVVLGEEQNVVRNRVAHYLEEHPQEFEEIIQASGITRKEYIHRVRNTNEYGGHLEIEIIQRITTRPIIVIRPDADPNMPDNFTHYQGEPIFVYFNGREDFLAHYDFFTVEQGYDAREILENIIQAKADGGITTYNSPIQSSEPSNKAYDHLYQIGVTTHAAIKMGLIDYFLIIKELDRYEGSDIAHIENLLRGEAKHKKIKHIEQEETRTLTLSTMAEEVEHSIKEISQSERKIQSKKNKSEQFEFTPYGSVTSPLGPGFSMTVGGEGAISSNNQSVTNTSKKIAKTFVKEHTNRVLSSESIENEKYEMTRAEETSTHDINGGENNTASKFLWVNKISRTFLCNLNRRQAIEFMIPDPSKKYRALQDKAEKNVDYSAYGLIKPVELDPTLNPATLTQDRAAELITLYKVSDSAVDPYPQIVHRSYALSTVDMVGAKTELESTIEDKDEREEAIEKLAPDATGVDKPYIFHSVNVRKRYAVNVPGSKVDYKVIGVTGTAVGYGNYTFIFGGVPFSIHMPDKTVKEPYTPATRRFFIDFSNNPGFLPLNDQYVSRSSSEEPPKPIHMNLFANPTANTGSHGILNEFSVSVNGSGKYCNVNFILRCEPTLTSIRNWQLKTYQAIVDGYNSAKSAYDAAVSSVKLSNTLPSVSIEGQNPLLNKKVMERELKRQAIELMTDNFSDIRMVNKEGKVITVLENKNDFDYKSSEFLDPPDHVEPGQYRPRKVDFSKLKKLAPVVLYFNQIIDWHLMNYDFLPYVWAERHRQAELMTSDDPDPEYRKFLQAGMARVIIPIPDKHFDSLLFFLKTKIIWNRVTMPRIGSQARLSLAKELLRQRLFGTSEAVRLEQLETTEDDESLEFPRKVELEPIIDPTRFMTLQP